MKLSALQKFILKECLAEKGPSTSPLDSLRSLGTSLGAGKVFVKKFLRFYQSQPKVPSKLEQVKIVSKSVDRLIHKGLLVGFGEQTQYKWFIKEALLTRTGRKLGKKLLGEQAKLPFMNQRSKKAKKQENK